MEIKTAIIIFIILILTFSIMITNQKDNKNNLSVESLMSEINSLKEDVKRLDNKNIELGVEGITPELKGALEEMVDERIENKMFDTSWKKYFYHLETFEYQDTITSWGQSITGTAGVNWTATSQPLFYIGADTNTSAVLVGKYVFQNDFLSFDKTQYFRTVVSLTDVTDVDIEVTIGGRYGFKITDDTIIGFADANETGTLKTLSNDEGVKLEARLYPKEKRCIFLINDEEKGVVVIPTTLTGDNISLWELKLTNNDADDDNKRMYIQWFELIQKT